MWNEKSKVLHKTINDLSTRVKQKDNALLVLADQNKHLQQLNRDKWVYGIDIIDQITNTT